MESVWSILLEDNSINSNNINNNNNNNISSNQKGKKRNYDKIDSNSHSSHISNNNNNNSNEFHNDDLEDDPLSLLTCKYNSNNNNNSTSQQYWDKLLSNGQIQLISWSNENMIAFTIPNNKQSTPQSPSNLKYTDKRYSVHLSNEINNDDQQQQQPTKYNQNIFIVRADLPHEYIKVKTNHQYIRHLEWSNQQGSLLMSSDHNQVCLWRKKEHVDEWDCIETLNYPYLLLTRFVSIKPSFYPVSYPEDQSDIETSPPQHSSPYLQSSSIISPIKKHNLNPTNDIIIQPLLLLTKEGKIYIICYNLIEQRWKEMIMRDFELSPLTTIDCADIISCKDENILISIYSKSIGNYISIYQLNYDIYTKFGQLFQLENDRINMNDFIGNDKMVMESKRSQIVESIVFDNSPNAIIVLKRGKDSSALYRWEKRESHSHHQSIYELFANNPKQSAWEEWVCTNQRFNGKSFNNSKNQKDQGDGGEGSLKKTQSIRNTTIFDLENDHGNNDNDVDNNNNNSPIHSIHYSNLTSILWVNYFDGTIEALRSESLESISKIKLNNNQNNNLILSCTSSPNGCLAAFVTSDRRVHIRTLPCTAFSKSVMCEWLNHLLQLSILRTTDWWDVVVMLRAYTVSTQTFDTYQHTLVLLMQDITQLQQRQSLSSSSSSSSEQANSSSSSSIPTTLQQSSNKHLNNGTQSSLWSRSILDSIRSSIYRIINGMELGFVDTQARQYLYYMLDTLKSSYAPICEHHATSLPEDKDNIQQLIDWVVEFTYFFFRNIYYIAYITGRSDDWSFRTPSELDNIESSHIFPLQYFELKKLKMFGFPLVSLLYDINFLLALFELLCYAKAFKEKIPSDSKSNIKFKESELKTLFDIYTPFIQEMLPILITQSNNLEIAKSFLSNPSIVSTINQKSGSSVDGGDTNSDQNGNININGNNGNGNSNGYTSVSSLPHFKSVNCNQLPLITPKIFTLINQKIPQMLIKEVNDVQLTNSLSILDLDPPLDGFLDQNPIKFCAFTPSGTNSTSSNSPTLSAQDQQQFKYCPKSSENMSLAYDIITRIPISPKVDKPIKKCTRCHRQTVLRKTALFWYDRWSMACPLCGGKWKLIKDNFYPQFQLQLQLQQQLQQQQQNQQQNQNQQPNNLNPQPNPNFLVAK